MQSEPAPRATRSDDVDLAELLFGPDAETLRIADVRRRFAARLPRMRRAFAHFARLHGLDRRQCAVLDEALEHLAAGRALTPDDRAALGAGHDVFSPERVDARAALAAFARLEARGAIGGVDAPAFGAAHRALVRIAEGGLLVTVAALKAAAAAQRARTAATEPPTVGAMKAAASGVLAREQAEREAAARRADLAAALGALDQVAPRLGELGADDAAALARVRALLGRAGA